MLKKKDLSKTVIMHVISFITTERQGSVWIRIVTGETPKRQSLTRTEHLIKMILSHT